MKMTLQDRLKQAREEAGLKQEEIAEKVGMKQSTYSDLERGKSKGSTLLPQIAFVLGVRPYWLATGKGPKSENEILDQDEREIVAVWRTLPDNARVLLLTQFRALRLPVE